MTENIEDRRIEGEIIGFRKEPENNKLVVLMLDEAKKKIFLITFRKSQIDDIHDLYYDDFETEDPKSQKQ